ncbi:MAG TPA: CBS domain-containing protein [Candidatus Krumholzibacteria bacterium]|nr:CBS domain-containing protein [Candidatus Krumholzibacteria bacterium]
MITVRDILDRKGRQVWSVSPTHTVYSALQMMSEKRIGSLLVLEHDRLVGIVSERDYARKIALAGKASRETAVRDIMTSPVFCVAPSHGIEECMALMTARSVRHLPVMSGDRIEGVVSIGDVVKATIDHQEFIIEQLEHFIAGR